MTTGKTVLSTKYEIEEVDGIFWDVVSKPNDKNNWDLAEEFGLDRHHEPPADYFPEFYKGKRRVRWQGNESGNVASIFRACPW